ncbi:MAG TPA: BON domain-containing protein [Candidatus Binatia bacterium]|nr:BON domain-containing protein [Candidatus Binatia bacterium]
MRKQSSTSRDAETLRAVRIALSSEPRLNLSLHPIGISLSDGDLILEGELPSLSMKKLALVRAAPVSGVDAIVDRLRVAPSRRMSDAEIRDGVCHALMQEPAFAEFVIRQRVKGRSELVRRGPGSPLGVIECSVGDGVVTLDGDVPGLEHKRLAGVLAWWVPGSRDVVNGLGVSPPEEDSDDEITDAVRLALEKDPFVNASQIRVSCEEGTVTLDGLVTSDSEKEMAEQDAWYVFGVGSVINRVLVEPTTPAAR